MRIFKLVGLVATALAIYLVIGNADAQDGGYFPEPDLENPAAPFIFTQDYAAAQGATAEWRKMEGVVIDPVNNRLFMAITRTTNGMSDDAGDIQLAENPCGMVLVGDVDENWNISEMRPLIIGGPYDATTDLCAADNMSEPDNIYVDANGDLWITEDTDLHVNNMVWKYEMESGNLLRFANMPLGSEGTGLHITANNELLLNIQHPDDTNTAPYNYGTVGIVLGYVPTDSFEPLPVAEGDAQLVLTIAAGEYQILAQGGQPMMSVEGVYGEVRSFAGELMLADGEAAFCNNPDGNMFIPTNDEGTEAILYSNWECGPGGVSQLTMNLGVDGRWVVSASSMVDFAPANGTLYNCNASVTPWNTGLTSEEDSPRDADEWNEEYAPILNDYVGGIANPYDFGYIIELIPNEDGSTTVEKRYAMGRRENEQSWVAPDEQTVYFGDDGTDKIFYKFIATTPGDLSAGTLYAARFTQMGEDNVSNFYFTMEWIELGTSNDADVEAAIRALDAQ